MNVPNAAISRPSIVLQEYEDSGEKLSWETLHGNALCDEDRKLADTLRENGIISIDELYNRIRIKAKSYVGHVRFHAFDLIVHPKFDDLRNTSVNGDSFESPLATLFSYAF